MDWGHEAEAALCGFNHEHSAAVASLPVAPEVVTRHSGVGGDSIVTMAPDMPRCGAISDSNSAVLITKNARSPLSGLLKRAVGAALRGPVLEEKKARRTDASHCRSRFSHRGLDTMPGGDHSTSRFANSALAENR